MASAFDLAQHTMPESIFTTEPEPRKRKSRQFSLFSGLVLLGVAAACFAVARRMTGGDFEAAGFLLGLMATIAAPYYLVRLWIRSTFFRRRSYLYTLMIAQVWFPFIIIFVLMFDYRGVGRYVTWPLTIKMTGLAVVLAGIVGVVIDVILRRRYDETFRAVVAGAITAVAVFLGLVLEVDKSLLRAPDAWKWATVAFLGLLVVVPTSSLMTLRAMSLRDQSNALRLRSRTFSAEVSIGQIADDAVAVSMSAERKESSP